MTGEIEQTILKMMDKLETDNIAGFTSQKYIVNDPDHMLQKHLFVLTAGMKFSLPKRGNIRNIQSGVNLIRMNHLQFLLYDERRMYELCREKSDSNVELAVVGYLHHEKDRVLTFKNLSLIEPFCISTKESLFGNVMNGSENHVTCKFVNCIFDKSDFKNGDAVGGVEVEDCIIKGKY